MGQETFQEDLKMNIKKITIKTVEFIEKYFADIIETNKQVLPPVQDKLKIIIGTDGIKIIDYYLVDEITGVVDISNTTLNGQEGNLELDRYEVPVFGGVVNG